jgi:hypothetical protein
MIAILYGICIIGKELFFWVFIDVKMSRLPKLRGPWKIIKL